MLNLKNKSLINFLLIFALIAGALVFATIMLTKDSSNPAKGADGKIYKLNMQHFFPATSIEHSKFFVPIFKRIEDESKGRIQVKVYPSMMLGGNARELLSQVEDGVVDIGFVVPSYTPGRMIRMEAFELPNVHGVNQLATSMAMYSLKDTYLSPDFKNVHPLFIYVHKGNSFHCGNGKYIRSPSDIEGLTIRTPSKAGSYAIELMNAHPFSTPLPHLRQSLSNGIVDCALIPFSALKGGSIRDGVVTSVTLLDEMQGIGTLSLGLFMNKDKYNSMPSDLRSIIDKHFSENLVKYWSRYYAMDEVNEMDHQRKIGTQINILSKEDTKTIYNKIASVTERWLEDAKNKGVKDASKLLQVIKSSIRKFESKYPSPWQDPSSYKNISSPLPPLPNKSK